jgi:phenylalanyl-tRNA synthetase beta subunit
VEVEQLIAPEPLDEKIVVALVKKVAQHAQADRLHLVEVDTGTERVNIVCGAANVREGLNVALAQIGSVLPDGVRIEKAKLRGEVSSGMLCSEQELGLGQDHNGIVELDESLKPGTKLRDVFKKDGVVDIKTAANRFDLLSVVGLAREVAAMAGVELANLPAAIEGKAEAPAVVKEDSRAARFMLVRMKVKRGGETPSKMRARLLASGVRSISPVVDITNYVNLELGQPLHAYDAAKVKLPLEVRNARQGEKLLTLDGVERKLTEEDLVVADQAGPVGLAGVMGGAGTEVGPETTEILLEAATFEAATVRKTAKRHGLRTEASARFERGLPVQLAPVALARAVELLKELAGGEVMSVNDQLNVWPWVQRIGLRRSLLNKLMGCEVSSEETVAALDRLGIEARPFDIAAEARKHLGKPYILGANFKVHGTKAFDCSYLLDYLYSLVGVRIGFTALGQFEIGRPVDEDELQPGDAVFYRGVIEKSVTDHYYTYENGQYTRHEVNPPKEVGHEGIYVGDGMVINAGAHEWRDGKWQKMDKPGVVEVPLGVFTKNQEYLGARRFADDLDDFITVPGVPWWRPDLRVPEDLAEEVVRVLGYDRVPATIPVWRPRRLEFDTLRAKKRRVQNVLYGSGLFEVQTYSFVSEEQLADVGLSTADHLKVKNPLSTEQAYLRSSLLASLLRVAGRNRGYAKELGFYEMSKVFVKRAEGEQPGEPERLAVLMTRREGAYRAVKGVLDALAAELAVELEIVVVDAGEGVCAPGRRAEVRLAGKSVGWIGQLAPELGRRQKLVGEAGYLELDLAALVGEARNRQAVMPGRFPGTQRDLAAVVPVEVSWAQVQVALADVANTRVEFVNDYYGNDVPAGRKSLAVRLHLAFADRTPTEKDAVAAEKAAWHILERKFDASRRD